MSNCFVTLSDVLVARGGPLEEEEIWALLQQATQRIMEDINRDFYLPSYIICPWSVLLSTRGNLSFQGDLAHQEVDTFQAPEKIERQLFTQTSEIAKMYVYSLGMTFYWTADYQVPQNQPVQLSDQLNSLLLGMCEDVAKRRPSLRQVLNICETCRGHSSFPAVNTYIRVLVKQALGNVAEVGQICFEDSTSFHLHRSRIIRERLHQEQYRDTSAMTYRCGYNKGSSHLQAKWEADIRNSVANNYQASRNRDTSGMLNSSNSMQWSRKGSETSSPSATPECDPESSGTAHTLLCLQYTDRKQKYCPEFIRIAEEPVVTLELPGSIVNKKKSHSFQRALIVVMLNGQRLEVKYDNCSKARDVFDMVVAYGNLAEHFYFGLAFRKGREFFFLDHDTKLYKVAPDGWKVKMKKKAHVATFTLFLRIKFFVDNICHIQHTLTRHQFYLQLRRDILEEKLYCNDETALHLSSLALQSEFGDYIPKVHGKDYIQMEHYIPGSVMEKMSLTCLKEELPRLHRNNARLSQEEAEFQFLKLTQQLPEYGVLFYQVLQEKNISKNELLLGICAKGIIVYEVKNGCRIAHQRFHWKEMERLSSDRRKLCIVSKGGTKYTFSAESTKLCQYLLDLCSAQHKFHTEMNSRQLRCASITDDDEWLSVGRSCTFPHPHFNVMKKLSQSEAVLHCASTQDLDAPLASKSCDNFIMDMEAMIRNGSSMSSTSTGRLHSDVNITVNEKRNSLDYLSVHSAKTTASSISVSSTAQRRSVLIMPEREVFCLSLRRDPQHGLGFSLVGGENTGRLDLGIFIASIIPGGPADRDGHIKPGARLISLNKRSLEGMSLDCAARILQSAPEEVELIISQPKCEERLQERRISPSKSSSSSFESFHPEIMIPKPVISSVCEPHMNVDELEMALSERLAPGLGNKMSVPSAHANDIQDGRNPLKIKQTCFKSGERYCLELVKVEGSLGVCFTGGVNTSVRDGAIYVKSVVPGGAADHDGRIKKGDRLFEVDGVSLHGITHKQAMECLKNTGQVVKLVLERGQQSDTEEHNPDSQKKPSLSVCRQETYATVSLAESLPITGRQHSFVTEDNTFDVTLRKNAGGLGFSFLQLEDMSSECRKKGIVRIKRMFPGQPAAENGKIEVGDVILLVNGTPVKGLSYKDVLHLLHGPHLEVKLKLCRPKPGVLPEIDFNILTPAPSPIKDMSLTASPAPIVFRFEDDPCTSTKQEEMAEHGSDSSSEPCHIAYCSDVCSDSDEERDGYASSHAVQEPGDLFQHVQSFPESVSETYTALGEDVRKNCQSVCDIATHQSATVDECDLAEITCYRSELSLYMPLDEEYLTISSTSVTPPTCSDSSRPVSQSTVTPQPRKLVPAPHIPIILASSEDEWEEIEEEEIVGVEEEENQESSPVDLNAVTTEQDEEAYIPWPPEQIPDIILVKGSNGQLGLKLTGGAGSRWQDVYVLEIVEGSPAGQEGSLQPGDKIIYICGVCTVGMTLTEAVKACESAGPHVQIKAIRNGNAVMPRVHSDGTVKPEDRCNSSPPLENQTYPRQELAIEEMPQLKEEISVSANGSASFVEYESCLLLIDLKKPLAGGLGFALVGGNNGTELTVKAINPGSISDLDGRLQVGDILLEVNGGDVCGLSHSKVAELLRQAQGTVELTVCRNMPLIPKCTDIQPTKNVCTLSETSENGDLHNPVDAETDMVHQSDLETKNEDSSLVNKTVCSEDVISEMTFFAQESRLSFANMRDPGMKTESTLLQIMDQHYEDGDMTGEYENGEETSVIKKDNSCTNEDKGSGVISSSVSTLATERMLISEGEILSLNLMIWPKTRNYKGSSLDAVIVSLQEQYNLQEPLKEFMALEHLKPLDDCLIGKAPENREKNRYREILPYDETRVPIGERKNYINASYIVMPVGIEKYHYISTQGPLPGTINDFWEMVWENNVSIIAMMTQELEHGKIKCHRYWPVSIDKTMDINKYSLILENYQVLDFFTISAIKIIQKETEKVHYIKQLQFTTWPDHGTPTSSEHLVQFVHFMRKFHQTGPVVVHCSAGVGRTGVLICADVMLKMIEKNLSFNIMEIVKRMRQQRYGMVQTKEQYKYCYKFALDVLHNLQSLEKKSVDHW